MHAVESTEPHRDQIHRALRNRKRVKAVEHADLLDAARTIPALNRAVRIAAHALRAPAVQLNVLTDSLLVPIAVHVDADEDAHSWEISRPVGNSYCKFVVWKQGTFLIDDARDNPLVRHRHVTRDLNIGAYLAVPIYAASANATEALVIGTICAIDHRPRQWSADDVQTLSDIALGVSDYIAARIRARSVSDGIVQQADLVLQAAGVGVLATDALGVLTYANPAAAGMLGYTPDELHGRDQHALIHHSHPDGRKYLERNCPNYIARRAGRACHTINDTFWKSDGTPLCVDSTMTLIFERGELVGTVLSFIDVTERRSQEASVASARLAAEVANHAKSELLAGVSIEAGLPLVEIGEISGRLEALLRGEGTAQQIEEVKAIQRSHKHLVGLMDNLRRFATLEAAAPPTASRASS